MKFLPSSSPSFHKYAYRGIAHVLREFTSTGADASSREVGQSSLHWSGPFSSEQKVPWTYRGAPSPALAWWGLRGQGYWLLKSSWGMELLEVSVKGLVELEVRSES